VVGVHVVTPCHHRNRRTRLQRLGDDPTLQCLGPLPTLAHPAAPLSATKLVVDTSVSVATMPRSCRLATIRGRRTSPSAYWAQRERPISTRLAVSARISTDDREQDPEQQLRQLRERCGHMGYPIVHGTSCGAGKHRAACEIPGPCCHSRSPSSRGRRSVSGRRPASPAPNRIPD
jgi:hypothetical protein